ncbi:MAG: class I SAM-dependent methyltransferase [Fulvivirga sp.]|uniref:class I SAM-dependent methyltransferase n=1 Tax=Fulvivirga sp. TaxID=1931237 RepID=UPI0032EEB47F
MTWEETIDMIREDPEYQNLVRDAYFEADLPLNVERYKAGVEYKKIKDWLVDLGLTQGRVLDIGSGNGISAISFALDGYEVTAVEPDPSDTVGAGAINALKDHYQLQNLKVYESFAEDIGFDSKSFDLVFVRQALHHANDLNKFVAECQRVLSEGGIMMTIRDHVIYDERDKEWFLEMHPLHKFYGGENAYRSDEYEEAFKNSGFEILNRFRYYDTPVNYFPVPEDSVNPILVEAQLKENLFRKISISKYIPFVFKIYKLYLKARGVSFKQDERLIPGRMYSYILKKTLTT